MQVPFLWKSFIVDIFSVWTILETEINNFIAFANSFHATIKFTHEMSSKQIVFLDTEVFKGPRFIQSCYSESKKGSYETLAPYYRQQHVRANISATWKIRNRCLPRSKSVKRPGTQRDPKVLANEFNKSSTFLGNLTAMKASLIAKDQGLLITDSAVFNEIEPQTPGVAAELGSSFSLKNVSENDVKSVIRGLSSNKAPGYDKMSARILKPGQLPNNCSSDCRTDE